MRDQIHFEPGKVQLMDRNGNPIHLLTLNLASEMEWRLYESPVSPEKELDAWLANFPQAWAETGDMRLVKHQPPVFVELKPRADPVWVMPQETWKGITPHIKKLLALGVLRACQSV